MTRRLTVSPWWLIETGEICCACGQQYARGTEIYCDACDGSVCAICVQQTETLAVVCPGCYDTEAEG